MTRNPFTDLVCAECGDTDIAVECVVVQGRDGELHIKSVCDDGHVCNVCGSEHITQRLSADAAMKEIQSILDKTEWNSATADNIAAIVRRTGRPVRDPEIDEPEDNPGSPVDTTQCQTNDWCTLPEAHIGPCRDVHGRLSDFSVPYGAAPGGA